MVHECPPSVWLTLAHTNTFQHANREALMLPICRLLVLALLRSDKQSISSMAKLGRGVDTMLGLLTEQTGGNSSGKEKQCYRYSAELLEATIRPLTLFAKSKLTHAAAISKAAGYVQATLALQLVDQPPPPPLALAVVELLLCAKSDKQMASVGPAAVPAVCRVLKQYPRHHDVVRLSVSLLVQLSNDGPSARLLVLLLL